MQKREITVRLFVPGFESNEPAIEIKHEEFMNEVGKHQSGFSIIDHEKEAHKAKELIYAELLKKHAHFEGQNFDKTKYEQAMKTYHVHDFCKTAIDERNRKEAYQTFYVEFPEEKKPKKQT